MCSVLTAERGGSLDVESDRDTASARAVSAARAGARDSDVVRNPTSVSLAVAGSEGCQRGGVAPSEIDSAERCAIALAELLCEAAVRGRVPGIDRDEAISEVFDGGGERAEGGRVRVVGASGNA